MNEKYFLSVLFLVICVCTAAASEVRITHYHNDVIFPDPIDLSEITVEAEVIPQLSGNILQTGIIELEFSSNVDSELKSVFQAAADKWGQIIDNNLSPRTFIVGADVTSCANGLTQETFTISPGSTLTHLKIFVDVTSIDGPNQILGVAAPCAFEVPPAQTVRPLIAVMVLDEDDLAVLSAVGSLNDVILHEMGHCLGLGVLWSNLLGDEGGVDPRYFGANGKAAYKQLGVSGDVPVENQGGGGTRDVHWRDSTFGNELMTGFLGVGNQPLSILTVKSLKDLNYIVNEEFAESYSLPEEPPLLSRNAIIFICGVSFVFVIGTGTFFYVKKLNRQSREKLQKLKEEFQRKKKRRRDRKSRVKNALERTYRKSRSFFSSSKIEAIEASDDVKLHHHISF